MDCELNPTYYYGGRSFLINMDIGKSMILEVEKERKEGIQIPTKYRVILKAISEGKSILGLEDLAHEKKGLANDGLNSTKNTTPTTNSQFDT